MVAKLSARIELEGGKEIERQLESLSKSAQKVFSDINKAASKAGGFDNLDTGAVDKTIASAKLAGDEIEKVKKLLGDTAKLEKLVQALSLVDGQFNKLGISARALLLVLGPVGAIVTVLSVALGVGLVTALVKAGQAISAIDAEAIKLGSTFEKFSKVREGLLRAGIVPESIAQGLEHLQSQIDKVTIARVELEITKAQKNIAAGWPPTSAGLEFLRQTALKAGEAGEAARRGLETIGRPITDNVTPLLDAMIRSAGGAAKAIPNIAAELQGLGTAGERARLVTGLMDAIKVESGNAVTATRPLLELLEKMPPGLERDKASVDAFGSALGTQVAQLLNLGTSISDIITKSQGMAQSQADAGNRIVQAFNTAKASLTGFDQLWGQIASSGVTALSAINSSMDTLITKLGEAVRLMGQLSPGGGGGGAAPALAGGGLMGGRGTGTSDSNLAWLSRGEHVMPARAVRQPGVLSLLEALRRSGGNLSGVLDRLGGFALGGLVGPVPAFAGGGVNSMSHITIAFPGVPPIGGLRAPGSVVDELRKAAGLAQVRSGGRKPSRYS